MPSQLRHIKDAVKSQLRKTDNVIASNEAVVDMISGLINTLSEVHGALSSGLSDVCGTLESGFSMLGDGLQELCFNIDDGFREVGYKLDLQNERLQAIKEILVRPLDTQAKELRQRAAFAYLNGWIDEAEADLLEAQKKNYQDFIVLHILGNIYHYHKNDHLPKALEYYEKAAKYAAPQSKKDACEALLCAAAVYKQLGKLEDAYKSTGLAISLLPGDTHNLYNYAAYASMTNHKDESIAYLRTAELTTRDGTWLIAADNDDRFSNVNEEKRRLKREIRDGQIEAVEHIRQKINTLRDNCEFARNVAKELGITELSSSIRTLGALSSGLAEIDKLSASNGYRDLLKAEKIAHTLYSDGLKANEGNISEWLKVKNATLGELKGKEKTEDFAKWFWLVGIPCWLGSCAIQMATGNLKNAELLPLFIGGITGATGGWVVKSIKRNIIRGAIIRENNALTRLMSTKLSHE